MRVVLLVVLVGLGACGREATGPEPCPFPPNNVVYDQRGNVAAMVTYCVR